MRFDAPWAMLVKFVTLISSAVLLFLTQMLVRQQPNSASDCGFSRFRSV